MRHLIVLVDALGWLTAERLNVLSAELPFRRKLTTVFGYSSTAIPSLLTGARPREHGHWFLYRRARVRRPFREAGWIDRLPGRLGERWRIRVRLQEYWRRTAGIRGYFSLYDVPFSVLKDLEPVETADTWATGSFPETPTLIDRLAARGSPYHVSDWRLSDAEKVNRVRSALRSESPETVVLYLTEVDAVQHRVGTADPALDAAVRRTADWVREIRGLMARQGPVTVTLFSDHGMTDVDRVEDLFAALASRDLRRGRDFSGFVDSTVARFWDVRDPERLRSALGELSWGDVLESETLRAWGVDFPNGEYGEHFFLAKPGVLIVPSDMGKAPLAAMHGYDPADPTSDACLLADRELAVDGDDILAVLPAVLRRLEEGR